MKKLFSLAVFGIGLFGLALFKPAWAGSVLLVRIHGEIERGVEATLRRAVQEAQENGAKALVVEINTPGGRLDAALQMKDALLSAQVPTIAWVHHQAFSAGALIALACHEIWMAPGSSMGAATPVEGTSGEKASEKIISAVRKAFAATAEARGRDPKIAQAMVDEAVEIEGLSEKGKILTLTAKEALRVKFADGLAGDWEDFLKKKKWKENEVHEIKPAWAERAAGFLTLPLVASILLSLGLWGLIFALKTPGLGVGELLSLLCLGLFFWSHALAGLAGWESFLLLLLGVIFLALEILVIPGFGIAGVLGLCFLALGVFLSLTGDPAYLTAQDYLRVAAQVVVILILVIVAGWATLMALPGSKFAPRGVVLNAVLDKLEAEPQTQKVVLDVGAQGVALSDLRPSGTALFGDHVVSVTAQGFFVPKGTPLRVVAVEGNQYYVRAEESRGSSSSS